MIERPEPEERPGPSAEAEGRVEAIFWEIVEQSDQPDDFRDRTRGHSKINAREALTALGTLIRLPFR